MGQPIPFTWNNNNQVVMNHLNRIERQAMNEQKSSEYEFEFHDGHDTGYPIYIRPTHTEAQKWNSNIPKIDTKNNDSSKFNDIKDITNWVKLDKYIKTNGKKEILTIIQKDWKKLELFAKRFWTGVTAPPELDKYQCVIFKIIFTPKHGNKLT